MVQKITKFILGGDMFTKPFKEGIHAFIEGKNANDNPYTLMGGLMSHYNQWQDGFLDAFDIANNEFDINFEVQEYMQKIGYKLNIQDKK